MADVPDVVADAGEHPLTPIPPGAATKMIHDTDAPFEQMSKSQIIGYVDLQLQFLIDRYTAIQKELTEINTKIIDTNANMANRVEKLLNLVTNHMTSFKQLVELADSYDDRISELEKDGANKEALMATLRQRQNKFTSSLVKMEKNMKEIVQEIENLHAKADEHDKFHWKLTVLATVGASVIGWLIAGDHFTKLMKFVMSLIQ